MFACDMKLMNLWQDFRYIFIGHCKGVAGFSLVENGDFRLLRSEDSQTITPSHFVSAVQPGTVFEISIVLRQAQHFETTRRICPCCLYANSGVYQDGWIEWQVSISAFGYSY